MKKLLFVLVALLWASIAQAQFADQRQYVGASGGSANAQTIAIPNYSLNTGVILLFKASFTNSGAMTLSANGSDAKSVLRTSPSGLAALVGGEVIAGQIAVVVYDGTQFELLLSANLNVITSNLSISVGPGQTYTYLADALTFLQNYHILPTATVTINVVGHVASQANLATWAHPDAAQILIRGTTQALTITSVASVSGSRGAWSVTYNVSSVSGVAVGDVLSISGLPQVHVTQGGHAAPVQGGFEYGLGSAAIINNLMSVTAASTTATSNAGLANVVQTGDIIGVLGQFRTVANSPGTGTGIVANANWIQAASGVNYWHHLKSESGTISTSGTALTGSSTLFNSRLNAGDMIIAGDGSNVIARVHSVSSNTAATLDFSVRTISGATFAILNAAWQHEGAFAVTAVGASTITVANTSRSEYPPPANGISFSGASALDIESTLTASSSGIAIGSAAALDIDSAALVGGTTGSGICAAKSCATNYEQSIITLGPSAAIIGFSNGIYLFDGAFLKADSSAISGSSNIGINATRASFSADTARVTGHGNYGVLLEGGEARLSRARLNNNGEDGIRTDAGGFFYADWPTADGNGGRALQLINKGGGQFVGGQIAMNGNAGGNPVGGGLDWQNGANGRATGTLSIGNRGNGFDASGTGGGEVSETLASANTGDGFSVASASTMSGEKSAGTFNAGYAYDVVDASGMDAAFSYSYNNSSGGYWANRGGRLSAFYGASHANTSSDYGVTGGGYIYCEGRITSPTPVDNYTVNKIVVGGALLTDGLQVIMGP